MQCSIRPIKKWLSDRFGDRVRFDEPMSRHTSLGVGGPAEALVCPRRREDVVTLITGAWERKIPYFVVGGGTNLLVSDQGVSGIVIALTEGLRRLEEIDSRGEEVQVYCRGGGVDESPVPFLPVERVRRNEFRSGDSGNGGRRHPHECRNFKGVDERQAFVYRGGVPHGRA